MPSFFKHIYPISILPSVTLQSMKTYIVTIYRQDKENPDALIGTVEEAGSGAKKVFHTFETLRGFLNYVKKQRNRGADRYEINKANREEHLIT